MTLFNGNVYLIRIRYFLLSVLKNGFDIFHTHKYQACYMNNEVQNEMVTHGLKIILVYMCMAESFKEKYSF